MQIAGCICSVLPTQVTSASFSGCFRPSRSLMQPGHNAGAILQRLAKFRAMITTLRSPYLQVACGRYKPLVTLAFSGDPPVSDSLAPLLRVSAGSKESSLWDLVIRNKHEARGFALSGLRYIFSELRPCVGEGDRRLGSTWPLKSSQGCSTPICFSLAGNWRV